MDGWGLDKLMDGSMDTCMNACMGDGWMDEGRMDGWMCASTDACIYAFMPIYFACQCEKDVRVCMHMPRHMRSAYAHMHKNIMHAVHVWLAGWMPGSWLAQCLNDRTHTHTHTHIHTHTRGFQLGSPGINCGTTGFDKPQVTASCPTSIVLG